MYAINNLTNNAFQTTDVQMPDGSTGTLNLYYRASGSRWFYDFIHPQFPQGANLGAGLCTHPNLLRQWANILDFGLACATLDGQDPVASTDFVTGYAALYVLDATDVLTVEAEVFNNVIAQAALAAQGT